MNNKLIDFDSRRRHKTNINLFDKRKIISEIISTSPY